MRKANIVFFVLFSALCALAVGAVGVFLMQRVPGLSVYPETLVSFQQTEELRRITQQLAEGNVFFWSPVITAVREFLILVVPVCMIAWAIYWVEGWLLQRQATKHYKAVAFVSALVALELTLVGLELPVKFGFDPAYLGYTNLELVLFLFVTSAVMIGYSVSYHWIGRSSSKKAGIDAALVQPA